MFDRLTSTERRALVAIGVAWSFGAFAHCAELPEAVGRRVERRLHPALPTVEELTHRHGEGDLRVRLYAASLVLRERRAAAAKPPQPIDPGSADRWAWERLPGIGPKMALAIVHHRGRGGRLASEADLLSIPGIGPKTIERLRPYLEWPQGAATPRTDRVDLNLVDSAYLQTLGGIGPKLADLIVVERRRRGGFRAWSEVEAVAGIGPTKLRILRDATRLGTPPRATTPGPEGNR